MSSFRWGMIAWVTPRNSFVTAREAGALPFSHQFWIVLLTVLHSEVWLTFASIPVHFSLSLCNPLEHIRLPRYFCLAVWPSIFATCNRRDKNKLSLPVQYCHFGSIHLTTDVSTKKISVSQYCPNNTLQITSIQLIININHMAARSGSSRWIPSVAGGKTYNIS